VVYRRLNLLQKRGQVLGADLKCPESRWGAAGPFPYCHPHDSTHDAAEDCCAAGFRPC